jgi:RNA polymerase sigma-70 factor (ECF subfamily)
MEETGTAAGGRGEAIVGVARPARFEDFYRTNRRRVHRALGLTLGDWDLAAEAADEAMLRTYLHWSRVRSYDDPAGFAYRVGVNWSRSAIRRLRRLVRPVPERPAHDPEPPDPGLMASVRSLSLPMRSVLVCRFFLDLTIEETAGALGISPGTVKSRQSRALERLRDHLEVAL